MFHDTQLRVATCVHHAPSETKHLPHMVGGRRTDKFTTIDWKSHSKKKRVPGRQSRTFQAISEVDRQRDRLVQIMRQRMDVPVPQVLSTVYPCARESEPRLHLARVPMTASSCKLAVSTGWKCSLRKPGHSKGECRYFSAVREKRQFNETELTGTLARSEDG